MAIEPLSTQVDRIVVDTEKKMLFVMRTAIDETVQDAQTLKTEGGRMPVKTGFLWQSGLSSLNAPPEGEAVGDWKESYSWVGEQLAVTLQRMKLGDTFYFGWTAFYASVQEVANGFLGAAVQNWQRHVDNAVSLLRKRG